MQRCSRLLLAEPSDMRLTIAPPCSCRHFLSRDAHSKHVERRIQAHDDDVNAVCYLDESGQVLLSGSDDSLIKIWDLRERSKQPQGVLSGHLAGITSLAVREDGMTIASNSKDQSLKIWDVRKMLKASKSSIQRLRRLADFDYRFIYAHRRAQDYSHEQQHPQGATCESRRRGEGCRVRF